MNWTHYGPCVTDGFVNCVFGAGGACKNPKHSGGIVVNDEAPSEPKKRKRERDFLFRDLQPQED